MCSPTITRRRSPQAQGLLLAAHASVCHPACERTCHEQRFPRHNSRASCLGCVAAVPGTFWLVRCSRRKKKDALLCRILDSQLCAGVLRRGRSCGWPIFFSADSCLLGLRQLLGLALWASDIRVGGRRQRRRRRRRRSRQAQCCRCHGCRTCVCVCSCVTRVTVFIFVCLLHAIREHLFSTNVRVRACVNRRTHNKYHAIAASATDSVDSC